MEQEPRRRRTLTPLSEELRAPVAWTPADPTRKERRRKAKTPPKTRSGVLLHGLARFTLVLGGPHQRRCVDCNPDRLARRRIVRPRLPNRLLHRGRASRKRCLFRQHWNLCARVLGTWGARTSLQHDLCLRRLRRHLDRNRRLVGERALDE